MILEPQGQNPVTHPGPRLPTRWVGTLWEDPSPALRAAGPSLCQNGTPGSTPGCTARPPSFHMSAGPEAEGAHPSARPGAAPRKQAPLNHASRFFQQGVYTVHSEGSIHANKNTHPTHTRGLFYREGGESGRHRSERGASHAARTHPDAPHGVSGFYLQLQTKENMSLLLVPTACPTSVFPLSTQENK